MSEPAPPTSPARRALWLTTPPLSTDTRHMLASRMVALTALGWQVLLVVGRDDDPGVATWQSLDVPEVDLDAVSEHSAGVAVVPTLGSGCHAWTWLSVWRFDQLRRVFAPHVTHTFTRPADLILGHAATPSAHVHSQLSDRGTASSLVTWLRHKHDRFIAPRRDLLFAEVGTRSATTLATAYEASLTTAAARVAHHLQSTRAAPHWLDWLAILPLGHLALSTLAAPFVCVVPAGRDQTLDMILMTLLAVAGGAVCWWRGQMVRARWFRELCSAGLLAFAGGGLLGLTTWLRLL